MDRVKKLYLTAMESAKFTFLLEDLEFIREEFAEAQQGKSIVSTFTGNCVLIGDIHGMLGDLQQYFNDFEEIGVVMLGDYVDRGPCSYECFLLVILRFLMLPDRTVVLRGNHETREMSLEEGPYITLLEDIEDKYDDNQHNIVRSVFASLFDYLNIYAVINNKFLCVHGCLPSFTRLFDELSEIHLPCEIPPTYRDANREGMTVFMSVWCDSIYDDKEFAQYPLEYVQYGNERAAIRLNSKREQSGEVVLYTNVAMQLDLFKLSALFRGHVQVAGLDVSPDGRIFTLQGHEYGYSSGMMFSGSVCVEVTSDSTLVLHVY